MMKCLGEPASESQLGVALTVAAVAMGLMLCAIMWQSSIHRKPARSDPMDVVSEVGRVIPEFIWRVA